MTGRERRYQIHREIALIPVFPGVVKNCLLPIFVSSRGFEGSSRPISFPSNPPGAKRHGIYLHWWFLLFLKNKALFKKGMKDCDPSPFKETCEKCFSDPERRMRRFVWHPVGDYVWNIITTLICKCSYNFDDRSDSIKSVALVLSFQTFTNAQGQTYVCTHII